MLHTIEIPPGQGLLVVDPGPLEPEGQGCVLECVLRLSAPLPDRRVAAALTLTELDPELVAPMGIEAGTDLQALLGKIDFAGKDVYLLPYAGSVVPMPEYTKKWRTVEK